MYNSTKMKASDMLNPVGTVQLLLNFPAEEDSTIQ